MDAYALLKTLYAERDDVLVRLVVNMVSSQAQAQAVANKLADVCQRYLGRNLSYLGFLPRDPHVSQAVMQSKPFTLAYPNAPVSKYMFELANRLNKEARQADTKTKGNFFKRFARSLGIASNE